MSNNIKQQSYPHPPPASAYGSDMLMNSISNGRRPGTAKHHLETGSRKNFPSGSNAPTKTFNKAAAGSSLVYN